VHVRIEQPPGAPWQRRHPRRARGPAVWAAVLLAAALTLPAIAQVEPDEEPLLPEAIGSFDIEMHGRYVRQWREDDGTLVLMFNGDFELIAERRQLSANDAVVWIKPARSETGRKYYELMVYLSEQAEVREPGGTTTTDNTLLVTNLRTFGRIIKSEDAHAPEARRDTPLYKAAVQARHRFLAGEPAEGVEPRPVVVARPEDLRKPKRPAPTIYYNFGQIDVAQTPDGETVQVVTGGIYLSRGGGPDSPVLEIRADSGVVFLPPASEGLLTQPAAGAAEPTGPETLPGGEPLPKKSGSRQKATTPQPPQPAPWGMKQSGLGKSIEAVYLEGDVVLSLGPRFVRANRLYYDFRRDRAILLDAVFRTDIPQRNVPLYVRADEIRQLSAREFTARHARVSTSEFYTPSYHLGVGEVYLRDRTVFNAKGEPESALAGTYELRNATLNVENVPILWWPYSRGDLSSTETSIRNFRAGYRDNRGASVESEWYLFNLLGVSPPPGVDASLRLDYFSKRGPGIGVEGKYQRENFFGLTRNYYIHDHGEDELGPLQDDEPDTHNRGRVLWRHRHYLPNDWELTLEVAYASDPGFLEEYRKSEWFEDKTQETVFYLKRARDTHAISMLANWRTLDFINQTEHLPDFTYRRIGDTWLDPVVLYHESHLGDVRYRLDGRHFVRTRLFTNDGETDVTFRTGMREEAELPIKLPGLNIVPFAVGRADYWDGHPRGRGGLWRGMGIYGIRAGAYLGRVYEDIRSELFDIDGIRHIIQPHFVGWWAHSNARSDIISPFDEGIETIDDTYGVGFGLRQVWQTRRGGDRPRTVDLLALNIEAGFFGDKQNETSNGYVNPLRPEDSRTRNYIAGDLIYRMSDTTALLYDFNYDFDDNRFDRNNVSLAVQRSPRLAYVFGWRHAGEIELDLMGGGFNYRLSEKHISAFRIWYDVDRGKLGEMTVSLIRRLPRWYFAVNFEVDEVFDDYTISVSLWPEGIPEWTLGSRRFTGLSRSMAIKP